MAKISFNRILPVLLKQEPLDGVLGLLREIIVLQAKLENIDTQDFYFQKGKNSHFAHLESLQKQYAQIVEMVNNKEVDFFIEQIRAAEEKCHEICGPQSNHPVFVKLMVDTQSRSEIAYYKNLLHAKSQFGKMKGLDEMIQDEESMLQIFS